MIRFRGPEFQDHTGTQFFIGKCLCACCIVNQQLEFNQTNTNTLLGLGKEVIGFW